MIASITSRVTLLAMSKYDIFAKRLRIFDIENWSSRYSTSQKLVDVEFYQKRDLMKCSNCRVNFHSVVLMNYKSYHNFDCSLVEEIKFEVELTRLQSHIQAKAEILTIELFKQKKIQLIEQKIQKQAQRDVELTKCQIKWETKKRAELTEQAQQKVQLTESTSTFVDIDIFDSTLICDILKFDLYSKVMNFLQHLQQTQHQYREQEMLDLLLKCLRRFAFAWFKDQIFIIIQDFDRDLACAFSTISLKFIARSFTSISYSSSQYHSCVECFAQFFSLSRLLKHIKQENACFKVICKHCEQDFNFKNKLHEHIREHHAQKFVISSVTSKNSNLRFSTSESMYKIKKKSAVCSSVSLVSSIFSATSTSIFESVSSKCSHLSIATLNITSKQAEIASMLTTREFTSKRVEIAAFNCSLTFSTSFSRTSVSKFYLTIDDLIRMFREKIKSFDLHSHQKHRFSSRSSDTLYQSRIIVYFLSAVNQKTSISQSLKSSNSKSFQQHTFAKSISLCRSALSEKSIISSYKKSDIFYISLQSRFSSRFSFAWFRSTRSVSRFSFAWSRSTRNVSRFSFAWSRFTRSVSRFSFAWSRFTFSSASSFASSSFFRFQTSNHVCCICFDYFNFRNDLFNYSRSSQRHLSIRRSMREVKEMISRFETKLRENEK